jgi:hypothetical protein
MGGRVAVEPPSPVTAPAGVAHPLTCWERTRGWRLVCVVMVTQSSPDKSPARAGRPPTGAPPEERTRGSHDYERVASVLVAVSLRILRKRQEASES